MIDLSSALLSVLPPTPAPIEVADGAVALADSFARTLGQFLDARDATLEPQPAILLVPARQATADPGKDLPPETGDDAETLDAVPAPFWFAPFPLPPTETALALTPDGAVRAAPPSTGERAIAPAPAQGPARTEAAAEQKGPPVETAVTAGIVSALEALPPKAHDAMPDVFRQMSLVAAKPVIAAPGILVEAKPAPATFPMDAVAQAIVVSTLAQPAGQVFASARAIAGSWREHAQPSDGRDQTDVPISFGSATPIDLRERAIVQAAADTAHAALDLTADTGLQQMIDRIETLRDTADAGDTRVRLIPNALGSIDVAVRQEGDRVHVRFTAEHEATRALIAEAQPRLTELAAARGVRIGDTSVSTGTGGGGSAPQPRPAPPRAPASASTEAATLSTDHRLA